MGRKKFNIFVRPLRDMPSWIGYDSLKHSGRFIQGMFSDLFTRPKKSQHFESYEQVVERHQLSQADLVKRKRQLFCFAMVYLSLAILLFAYAVHHFLLGMVLSGISTLCLVMMLLSFAFREHFWYIQMRHQRLGLTFNQWLRATCRGDLK